MKYWQHATVFKTSDKKLLKWKWDLKGGTHGNINQTLKQSEGRITVYNETSDLIKVERDPFKPTAKIYSTVVILLNFAMDGTALLSAVIKCTLQRLWKQAMYEAMMALWGGGGGVVGRGGG